MASAEAARQLRGGFTDDDELMGDCAFEQLIAQEGIPLDAYEEAGNTVGRTDEVR